MATKYIATTGNDTTGDGSSGNPWLTLEKGLTGSTTGDTLVFAAGTYSKTTSQEIANRTIQGATGGAANSTTGWTVFSGGGGTGGFSQTGGTTNIYNIWFNNVVRPNTFNGFIRTSGVTTTTVRGCRFSGITCASHSNYAGLIGSADYNARVTSLTISSCIFDDIQCYMTDNANYTLFGGRGPSVGSTFRFNNNSLSFRTESLRPGYLFGGYNGDSCDYLLKNNIFKNACSGIGFIALTPGTFTNGFIMQNNCYNGAFNTSGCTITNSTTSNPLFIDENNNDFRLQPTSPCIGTGTVI